MRVLVTALAALFLAGCWPRWDAAITSAPTPTPFPTPPSGSGYSR